MTSYWPTIGQNKCIVYTDLLWVIQSVYWPIIGHLHFMVSFLHTHYKKLISFLSPQKAWTFLDNIILVLASFG